MAPYPSALPLSPPSPTRSSSSSSSSSSSPLAMAARIAVVSLAAFTTLVRLTSGPPRPLAAFPPRQLKMTHARRIEMSRRRKVLDERRSRTLERLGEGIAETMWAREEGSISASSVLRGAEAEAAEQRLEEWKEAQRANDEYAPLTVCDRPADVGSVDDFASLQEHASCPPITKDQPILMLRGGKTKGRTGNNLIEFLHAVQEARDGGIQLGVMANSWATHLLTKMWLAIEGDDWADQFEKAFCLKIFYAEGELEGWDVVDRTDTAQLLHWKSELPLGDYMQSQEGTLRELFRHYNTGAGHEERGWKTKDMCSGIKRLFGEKHGDTIYSVIHSRSLEGVPGIRLLGRVAKNSGCDPVAALEMRPDYVKSILAPLGMLGFPIVLITDHENNEVIERLQNDPDIGPQLRLVPPEACWLGGDLTLGVMSNVFIGNPASTFTGFIAKARLALGFGNNYLFRAKDEGGKWRTVCGDHCIFDHTVMGDMS